MYTVPDTRMDWFAYENIRKSLQHKHAEMLRNRTPKITPCCKWIRSGEEIVVNDILLKKGFFYIGEFFEIPKSYKKKRFTAYIDQAYNRHYNLSRIFGPVIQDDLPIDKGKLRIIPFSGYIDMHPTQRYEYLLWLAEKKHISEISSSILLLYLLGLQLRMFIDDSTDNKERLDIIVHALTLYSQCLTYKVHTLYLNEFEFFINAAICCFFRGQEIEILNSLFNGQYNEVQENGSSLIYVICNCIVREQGNYIPEGLITNYYVNHVQQFVESEINNLVNSKDTITSPRSYISMYYSFAHISSILSDSLFCYDLLLNIRLQEDYQICYTIRDSIKYFCKQTYAKLKDYRNLKKLSPTLSFFALPSSFNVYDYEGTGTYIEKLRKKTESQEFSTISMNDILDIDNCVAGKVRAIDKNQITSIIKCFKRIGYGIAPNYMVDETRFTFGDNCIIYKEDDSGDINITLSRQLESLIKACVVVIDTTTSKTDTFFIDDLVKTEVNHAPTRRYLAAYFRWIMSSTYKLTKADKNDIQKLPNTLKNRYGVFLARIASLDYLSISKREEKLKDILPLFGVESQAIHTLIHRSLISSDEEFATLEKVTNAPEYEINTKTATHVTTISLSSEQINKIEKQTEQAQEILSGIFFDDEKSTETINNSNNAIHDIMKILLSKDTWKRNEVESKCQEHHLMIGSVLEQINDYAYSKIEDAVIEDDGDTIYVMTDYKDKLI